MAGAFFGLIHAILTVPLGLSQHVSGIGVTLFATSLSYFIYRTALPDVSSPPRIEAFKPLDIPVLSDLPFIGPALFQQTSLTFLALVLVAVTAYVLYRTPLGLAIRAVGDNPSAVESQGLSVYAIRMGTVVAGSAIMALGGAFLTMSAFDAFFFGMVNGRGWICIALTVFASWRPGKALIGALLFGAFDAFQVRLQTEVGSFIPGQVFLMMPYLLSIAALIVSPARPTIRGRCWCPTSAANVERTDMSFDLLVKNANLPDGRHGHRHRLQGRPDRGRRSRHCRPKRQR